MAALVLGIVVPQIALGQSLVVEQTEAIRIARQRGWLIRTHTITGGTIELKWLADDIPLYYETHNVDAAHTISTNTVHPGGASGLGLTGAGMTVGMWDGGRVRGSHQDFSDRVTPMDGFGTASPHATHVAGTIMGSGLSPADATHPAGQSLGMAFEATLNSYNFTFDGSEMARAAQDGLTLSNHSYGIVTGWYYGNFGAGEGWYWFGDVRISFVEDYFFGFYSFHTQRWDDIAFDHPYYLIVKSAGNERADTGPNGKPHYVLINGVWTASSATRNPDGNAGYDSISHAGVSKNVLTVGAVEDLEDGYPGSSNVLMTSFSGWGPTDDGRIKPDVVANGTDLWSATSTAMTAYDSRSGTSMSAASATGSLALLTQHYRATHAGANISAAMLKGLVIHTANEAGDAPGPDFQFGWGLIDTAAAANLITLSTSNLPAMQSLTLGQDQLIELTVVSDGSEPLRVTLCWTDPPGQSPPSQLDPTTPMLVNDIDLRIVDPEGTVHEPWRLNVSDPTAPATRGDNAVDNVEMVHVDAPIPGEYRIQIRHKGTLTGGLQPLAMLSSGATSSSPITGACCNLTSCVATTTETSCSASGGSWYGGGHCDAFACPPVGACCVGCPPNAVCLTTAEAQCIGLAGAWSQDVDCNNTTCAPPTDDCVSGAVTVADGVYVIDNRCATTDGPPTVSCETGAQPFSNDLWLHYTATCTGTLTVSMCGDADYDAIMAVYTDGSTSCLCPLDATNQDGLCADDTCGEEGGPSTLTRSVVAGQCVTVRVGGWNNEIGTGSVSIQCTPAVCPLAKGPLFEPTPISKNRYLAFVPGLNTAPTALRLTGLSLDGFPQYDGVTRWVGPPKTYPDPSFADPGHTFLVAHLQCEPHFMDWSTVDTLHVIGAEIVPQSTYAIQAIHESCVAGLSNEQSYSVPLMLTTMDWGDMVEVFAGPGAPSQPDFRDIAAEVASFLQSPDAIGKARTQLRPNVPRVTLPVDFKDISDLVQAFLGQSYHYEGPCVCPSAIICGETACLSDLDCFGGVCFEGFCRDVCARCAQP